MPKVSTSNIPGEGVDSGEQPRRTSSEVRHLLLTAARHEFVAHGYPRTSTVGVSTAAGVNEALLFRHFRSKANLFDEAVLQPVASVVDDTLS